mmetsp:Transcript_34058/g.87077  ORF Transcript_34058/g.87077 Transcript_34058/m.87077 type:complete len:338 (+) Transcript_34058:252-1265(+)
MSQSHGTGVEVVRLIDVTANQALLPQLATLLSGQSWQSLIGKGLSAIMYGTCLFVGLRFFKRQIGLKLAELRELQRMYTSLMELLSDWKLAGDENSIPTEFENDQTGDCGTVFHKSSSGMMIQFRRSRGKGATIQDLWEWSRDGEKWVPTSDLAELERMSSCACRHNECSPNKADKVFILRLEVERQIRNALSSSNGRQSVGSSAFVTWPPPLDPSTSQRNLQHAPQDFLCPITLTLMTEPVIAPSGITYDRPAVLQWIASHHTDPATGDLLEPPWLVPNLVLRDIIQKWLVDQPAAQPPPGAASPDNQASTASMSAASFTSPSAVHQRKHRALSYA